MRRLSLLWAFMPALVLAQSLDSLHIMVDAEAVPHTPYVYNTFQSAAEHFVDGVTVYIRPGVYWIDDPDDPTVRVGKGGREPFGMTIRCPRLRLVGLADDPCDVVLASQRGQTQGAVGNFTMFDFWTDSLVVENMTMGNYCNVDLVYPRNPRLNRPKRSGTITQAHVGYVHGRSLTARRVRFVSRLNLNPLNGADYSYYEDCHFECTDDALNGRATYRHCDFDFYGSKPWWSTSGSGALLIDCDFYAKSDNRETYFCKRGGPLTLINCRYHAPSDSTYIGWTAYPQPWLRCYQQGFTLNGRPYLVGSRQPQNTVVLSDFNGTEPPYLSFFPNEAALQTGRDTLRLQTPTATIIVIPNNDTDETDNFSLVKTADNGREAACHLSILPSELPPPNFVESPRVTVTRGLATIHYVLDLQGRRDDSRITWYRNGIPVSVSHEAPVRTYLLTEADKGQRLTAVIEAKQPRSQYAAPVEASLMVKSAPKTNSLATDFHDFPCDWQPEIRPGYWTVDGYKPRDTADFDWSFDTAKPMWEYAQGFNGAVGMGLLQAQRGARLMYTPVKRTYGNMSLVLCVDPTKTAGQGFGSATGQYMDVCLKFDTQTLTGYGLRIVRTTKHAKAVDFLLVRYDHGVVTPLTDPVSATCYRTGCTISIDFIGNKLSAHVDTKTPRLTDSDLPHTVDLTARVEPNPFGGIHIQHTGSCGESTTMLHSLQVKW